MGVLLVFLRVVLIVYSVNIGKPHFDNKFTAESRVIEGSQEVKDHESGAPIRLWEDGGWEGRSGGEREWKNLI